MAFQAECHQRTFLAQQAHMPCDSVGTAKPEIIVYPHSIALKLGCQRCPSGQNGIGIFSGGVTLDLNGFTLSSRTQGIFPVMRQLNNVRREIGNRASNCFWLRKPAAFDGARSGSRSMPGASSGVNFVLAVTMPKPYPNPLGTFCKLCKFACVLRSAMCATETLIRNA